MSLNGDKNGIPFRGVQLAALVQYDLVEKTMVYGLAQFSWNWTTVLFGLVQFFFQC